MIGRRHFAVLAAAALIAPRAFAFEAGQKLPPHDRKAARAEFARIVAMFNQGDVAGFLAYGPPAIISYDTPEVAGRKAKLSLSQIPDFIAERNSTFGRPDEVPTRIDSFNRMKNVFEQVIYSTTLKRSVFTEEFCDVHLPCMPEGYTPMYEFWRVWFDGPRIQLLEQVMVIS